MQKLLTTTDRAQYIIYVALHCNSQWPYRINLVCLSIYYFVINFKWLLLVTQDKHACNTFPEKSDRA